MIFSVVLFLFYSIFIRTPLRLLYYSDNNIGMIWFYPFPVFDQFLLSVLVSSFLDCGTLLSLGVHWRSYSAAMLGRTVQSIGVNAHRLSKNVTLYLTEASPVPVLQNETSQNHKPLTLMLPWLGSRPQAVDKYCQIYFRTGFDVLVIESEVN